MSKAWKTKYGPRRVKHDPPTLQEAIFAARGLTDDPESQIEIAASLMGLPQEEVRTAAMKYRPDTTTHVIATNGKFQRSVVVERKVMRRPLSGNRPVSGMRLRP
jgi:hypothetical protein